MDASDDSRFEVRTLVGHRRRDGTLESVAVTVGLDDDSRFSRTRIHYRVEDGLARLSHFVVGDELSVFSVEDFRCVPIAERAITAVPGVEEVEPAEATLECAMQRDAEADVDFGSPRE